MRKNTCPECVFRQSNTRLFGLISNGLENGLPEFLLCVTLFQRGELFKTAVQDHAIGLELEFAGHCARKFVNGPEGSRNTSRQAKKFNTHVSANDAIIIHVPA